MRKGRSCQWVSECLFKNRRRYFLEKHLLFLCCVIERLPCQRRQETGKNRFEFFDVDRFGHESVTSGLTCRFHIIFKGIGRLHNHGDILIELSDLLQGIYTVHFRHFDIHKDQVGMFFLIYLQQFFSGLCMKNITMFLQYSF